VTVRKYAILFVFLSSAARAEEPAIEAQLSADAIALDETVQLNINVARDASQAYQGYLRPDFKDWDILHQGQAESTQWTIVNGRQSVRTVEQHVYLLRPKHRGACLIPQATARVNKREWRSRELKVLVSAPARKLPPGVPQPPPSIEGGGPEPDTMRGDEDLYIDARSDKPSVYVGEQLLASWALYTRTDILRYRSTVEPKHEDFWCEDL
jgi:hypothetical protein